MTFGEAYLKHLEVLQNVGMTRIDEVEFEGQKIVPIKFLKALLPDPGVARARTTPARPPSAACARASRTASGSATSSTTSATTRRRYKEVRAQAISYTTGVPAVIGAVMMVTGKWKGAGVFNMEQLDPDPFLEDVGKRGLPWHVEER